MLLNTLSKLFLLPYAIGALHYFDLPLALEGSLLQVNRQLPGHRRRYRQPQDRARGGRGERAESGCDYCALSSDYRQRRAREVDWVRRRVVA